ncbi:MAG: hypothetical protein ACREGD_05165 [Candidatus Saccharimonadales bacterium]
MTKVSVRRWEVETYRSGAASPDRLFITYPEDNSGHDLITCLNCGEVYAVTVAKEVYVGPPLAEKVEDINCVSCGKLLDGNCGYYPEVYASDGNQHAYKRETEVPDDSLSIVKQFYGIYE